MISLMDRELIGIIFFGMIIVVILIIIIGYSII